MRLSINSLEMRALKVKKEVKMALFWLKMAIFAELKLITQIFLGPCLMGYHDLFWGSIHVTRMRLSIHTLKMRALEVHIRPQKSSKVI